MLAPGVRRSARSSSEFGHTERSLSVGVLPCIIVNAIVKPCCTLFAFFKVVRCEILG